MSSEQAREHRASASANQSRINVETSLIHPSGKIVAACTCDGRSVARREESP
jgi:hypothetical protein